MTHGSLFAGIDGFAEGAKRAGGIETVFGVEIHPYRQAVLNRHCPNAKIYDNIKEFEASQWRGHIDILTGGFPCQDISAAGRGAGIRGGRSSLWSEYWRCIDQIRPRYAVIENSPRLLRKGFEKVLWDLAQIGYDAQWDCISAEAFGMPHKRERLFVVAYPYEIGGLHSLCDHPEECRQLFQEVEAIHQTLDVQRDPIHYFEQRMGRSAIRRMDDGFPGRPQLIDRLEAVGDSVSPVITEYLFHCIKIFDQNIIT